MDNNNSSKEPLKRKRIVIGSLIGCSSIMVILAIVLFFLLDHRWLFPNKIDIEISERISFNYFPGVNGTNKPFIKTFSSYESLIEVHPELTDKPMPSISEKYRAMIVCNSRIISFHVTEDPSSHCYFGTFVLDEDIAYRGECNLHFIVEGQLKDVEHLHWETALLNQELQE